MKILYLVPRYFPAVGGSENLIKFFAEGMARDGHEVHVYTSDVLDLTGLWAWMKDRKLIDKPYEIINGVHVHRFSLNVRWIFGSFFLTKAVRKVLQYIPLWQIQCLRGNIFSPDLYAKAFFGKEQFDIVHVTPVPFDSLFYCGFLIAKRNNAKLICTPAIHIGENNGENDYVKEYTRPYTLAVLEKYSLLLTNTDIETKFLSEKLRNKHIETLGLGISVEASITGNGQSFRQKYSIPQDAVILYSIGTKCRDKGTYETLEAFEQIRKTNQNVYLVLAGNEFPDVTEFMKTYSSKHLIYFENPISDQEKWDIVAAGDILLFPSRTDSFGIVILEAWANNNAVIGADAGGIPGVITDREDGLLVRYGSSEALEEAIRKLLENPQLRHDLAKKGNKKLHSLYTEEIILKKLRSYYS